MAEMVMFINPNSSGDSASDQADSTAEKKLANNCNKFKPSFIRAFSLASSFEQQSDTDQASPNLFSSTATSVFNKINPFESPTTTTTTTSNNNNQILEQSGGKQPRRTASLKQRGFISKLDFSLFGNNTRTNELDEKSLVTNNDHIKPPIVQEQQQQQQQQQDQVEEQEVFTEEMYTPFLSASDQKETISSLNRHSSASIKRKTKPVGALEYEVKPNETIEKIALKWNTVPSEILSLNKLASRVIFAGQTIFVPDPDYVAPSPPLSPPPAKVQFPLAIIDEMSKSHSDKTSGDELTDSAQNSRAGPFKMFKWKSNSNPKPGHVEKQKQAKSFDYIGENLSEKLLNAIDSISSSDSNYEMHRQSQLNPNPNPNANPNSIQQQQPRRHTLTEEEAKQLDEECMQRFLKLNCKILTYSKGVCFDGVLIITPSALMFDPLDMPVEIEDSSTNSSCLPPARPEQAEPKDRTKSSNSTNNSHEEASAIIPIEVISNVILYENLPLKDVQEYFEYQKQMDMLDSHKNMEALDSHNSSSDQHQLQHDDTTSWVEVTFDLKRNEDLHSSTNEVFVEDESALKEALSDLDNSTIKDAAAIAASNVDFKLDLTVSSEESGDSSRLSSSSPSCPLNPSILCIKVNKNKDLFNCPLNRKMKNRLESEFWFQINDGGYRITDKICAFFLEWKNDPHQDQVTMTQKKSGFQLVKQDKKLIDLIADHSLVAAAPIINLKLNKSFSVTNRLINRSDKSFVKDWEVVNLQELELKLKQEIEIENEYKTLPTLMNKSTILKEDNLRKLNITLIPRAIGFSWILSFSTEINGFSLLSLYRSLADVEGPCLFVVMDTNRNIFGAMTASKVFQSDHQFYGTGESFLYTFSPSFKVFKWTGENNFFTRGLVDSLAFGCSEGHHGLWFDGDLLNGHSQKCQTYDNEHLATTEYFTIASLEVWTFSDE
jgi:LysM repeat protein